MQGGGRGNECVVKDGVRLGQKSKANTLSAQKLFATMHNVIDRIG